MVFLIYGTWISLPWAKSELLFPSYQGTNPPNIKNSLEMAKGHGTLIEMWGLQLEHLITQFP